MTKERLIEWANSQIGYREGANNYNKYAENTDLQKLYGWKPQSEPWCDTFVDCGFCECYGLELASKLTYQPIGRGSAACRVSAGFYKANNAFYNSPEVGDQIFFFYEGDINHTGIVTSVSGGLVYTIEGNTSDMVARRTYGIGNSVIAGYGRPNWPVLEKKEEPKNEAKVEGLPMLRRGDKGEVVRAAQFLLNGRKCSCGVWGADGDFGPSTEAAVLAFQRRNDLDPDGIIGNATWSKLLGL